MAEFGSAVPVSARAYSYVLIAVALLSAGTRLRRSHSSVEAQSKRLEDARVRVNQRLQALVILAAAAALTAFSFLHIGQSWLWLAAVVAWLSGMQSLLALAFRSPKQLLALERIFGLLFLGVAVLLYFMFVR